MSGSSVSMVEIHTAQGEQPRAGAGHAMPRSRPNPLAAALSVVLGLAMLGLALIILLPLALIAIVLVTVWLVWALLIGGLARLPGGSFAAGRRNVRIVGPQRRV